MAKNRILYGLFLLAAVVFHSFYTGWFSFFLLMFALLLPVFSLLISLPAMLHATYEVELPVRCFCGQTAQYRLTAQHAAKLPVSCCRFLLTVSDAVDGEACQQKLELVFKEMKIAFSNGSILGILSFALIGLYIALFKGKTFVFAYAVSGCIGVSLLLAMVISGAVGTLIPLFFKKIHVDPAVASGPLITTVNDLVAVVSYYGLSWILLINILHLAG